jgi:hydroxymethylbilane synthase
MTSSSDPIHIQIGGRKSKLAVLQSYTVKKLLETKYPNIKCDVLALSTLGDQVLLQPLYTFGGKSLWTKELEVLLLGPVDNYPKLDLIVHSLKDMPTHLPAEFELGAIVNRQDPRDAVCMKKGSTYKKLEDLPDGSVVGTSSIRRSAQLLKNFPNLRFESIRGNIQTRFKKLDDPLGIYSCVVLANAGLVRLGLQPRISQLLDAPDMYYAVGQGALGIEIRSDDDRIKDILKSLEDLSTTYCCLAERSLMRYLEGGCSVPLGVHSNFDEETGKLTLKAILVSPDGRESIEDEVSSIVKDKDSAEIVGITLGSRLIENGAQRILDTVDTHTVNEPPSAIMTDCSGTNTPEPPVMMNPDVNRIHKVN